MRRLLIAMFVAVFLAALTPVGAQVSNGHGLYPITRRNMPMDYGQLVELRVLDDADKLPGNFGWLSWSGSTSAEDLAASLLPPGNAPSTYYNPGTPDNDWTADYSDTSLDVGDWVQGMPGQVNADDVQFWLDWHIANPPMIIPLYDAVSGGGSNSHYRIASFAAFELESYDLTGNDPSLTGKFLKWVTNGDWTTP